MKTQERCSDRVRRSAMTLRAVAVAFPAAIAGCAAPPVEDLGCPRQGEAPVVTIDTPSAFVLPLPSGAKCSISYRTLADQVQASEQFDAPRSDTHASHVCATVPLRPLQVTVDISVFCEGAGIVEHVFSTRVYVRSAARSVLVDAQPDGVHVDWARHGGDDGCTVIAEDVDAEGAPRDVVATYPVPPLTEVGTVVFPPETARVALRCRSSEAAIDPAPNDVLATIFRGGLYDHIDRATLQQATAFFGPRHLTPHAGEWRFPVLRRADGLDASVYDECQDCTMAFPALITVGSFSTDLPRERVLVPSLVKAGTIDAITPLDLPSLVTADLVHFSDVGTEDVRLPALVQANVDFYGAQGAVQLPSLTNGDLYLERGSSTPELGVSLGVVSITLDRHIGSSVAVLGHTQGRVALTLMHGSVNALDAWVDDLVITDEPLLDLARGAAASTRIEETDVVLLNLGFTGAVDIHRNSHLESVSMTAAWASISDNAVLTAVDVTGGSFVLAHNAVSTARVHGQVRTFAVYGEQSPEFFFDGDHALLESMPVASNAFEHLTVYGSATDRFVLRENLALSTLLLDGLMVTQSVEVVGNPLLACDEILAFVCRLPVLQSGVFIQGNAEQTCPLDCLPL